MKDKFKLLESWVELNKHINKLKEQDILDLIEAEKVGSSRSGFLTRLHGRYNKLRVRRERGEILGARK